MEQRRCMDVVERTNMVFTLFDDEITLQKDDANTALTTYMVALGYTKDSVIVECVLEVAVLLSVFESAEMIY